MKKIESVELKKALWRKPKEPVTIIEKGNTLTLKEYENLEKYFQAVSNMLQTEGIQSYYFPLCPNCGGILGQMCCSKLQICLKCGREYEISEYKQPHK